MENNRTCHLCGRSGKFDYDEDKSKQLHYCAIGCHLACADCINWSANGRGYHDVCKECSSKFVLYDRQTSLFFGEPRFWNGEKFIFSLDQVDLYSQEHLAFLNEKDGQFPMPVKDAILLQQYNIIPFLEGADRIDEIINEHTDIVHYAEGKMDINCRCGELYATLFTWEDNDDTEFGNFSTDPCPKCGEVTNMRIYILRKDLNLGTKNPIENQIKEN